VFRDHALARLAGLSEAGLLRRPRTVASPQGPVALIEGRERVVLCSNDYLGLATAPDLRRGLADAAAEWGTGSGASRLISGTMTPHRVAEAALARFVDAPAALLFSTGYAANVGAIQALVGPGDIVLSDALNHASLIDGCRLSRADVRVFRHRDVAHAEALLREHRGSARVALLVTDALFSMEGDLAPLRELRALCDRWDVGLLVDEAHSLGTRGPSGRGACVEIGIRPDVLIGTLGKALALSGAFAAGDPAIVALIENRARSFVFSTAPPPAIAAVVPTALRIVEESDVKRATLRAHADALRAGLSRLGLDVPPGDSPIVPVLAGAADRAIRWSNALFEGGVFVQAIRPPTVPEGTSRLRVVPTASHLPEHLDRALAAFAAALAGSPA
jgi:8-amino-7-oxononanoate synthase